jgi:hypothetical protein
MARGWESKSVEDQIGAAEAEREKQAKPHRSPEQRARWDQEQSLLLSRAQILSRMHATANPRYRAQLQLALNHVEAQLKARGTDQTDKG